MKSSVVLLVTQIFFTKIFAQRSSPPRFTLWPRRENQELLDGLEKIGGQTIEQDLGIANSLDEQKNRGQASILRREVSGIYRRLVVVCCQL